MQVRRASEPGVDELMSLRVESLGDCATLSDTLEEKRESLEVTSGRNICDCEHQSSEECDWKARLLDWMHNYWEGGIVERLACSPPAKATRITPYFRMWDSCRTMPLVGGFSRNLPFPPPLHPGAAPYSPQSHVSALKTSMFRAVQISCFSLTHYWGKGSHDPGDGRRPAWGISFFPSSNHDLGSRAYRESSVVHYGACITRRLSPRSQLAASLAHALTTTMRRSSLFFLRLCVRRYYTAAAGGLIRHYRSAVRAVMCAHERTEAGQQVEQSVCHPFLAICSRRACTCCYVPSSCPWLVAVAPFTEDEQGRPALNSNGATVFCVDLGSYLVSSFEPRGCNRALVTRDVFVRGCSNVVARPLASQRELGSIPGGVAPRFSRVAIVPDGAVGRWDLPFSLPFHSGAALYSTRFNLIGFQDLYVKSRSNLFTLSIAINN
ncbi:hypothetical protein PR048_010228 [Dryococelus australis]|uniref:Uncharacterized protein n=1 Tax=Dryococelus australis TaxID=614101 RepID=A0ABQ9I278_9NEOP|nr:hypothetical protein PR048_010228 [Dryococelus australis]